ncbi:MAG: beta-lactamase family protein, partial [Bacteroidota bacterium]|nr:beta-lactamase family protein [Bacteroidota bacterium]
MKRLFKVIILLMGIMSSFVANAQTPAVLDSLFNSLVSHKQLNGTALVAENGHVIFDKSSGFANFKNSVLNTDKTEFTLASVSKVFTSAAVLQLRDKGKFKLDDEVLKYLSGFPYPGITIRNLLSHTSGLPDYQLYEDQMNKNPDKIFTNADILPSLRQWKKPLAFKPGEKWQYSNTNFCLLALLVEKVSGMSFQQYLQKYIFIPAKMINTYFAADPAHSADRHRATNYEYPFLFSGKLQDVDSLKKYHWRTHSASGFVGQGNIIMTSTDLLKFDQALYSGKILN